MLRCFLNIAQNNWDSYLLELESAYSGHTSLATKHTPFILAYGKHQFSLVDLSIPGSSTVFNEGVGKLG